MADEGTTEPREDQAERVPTPRATEPDDNVQIDIELRDGLPGGRAVIAVEQDGAVTWLADKRLVPAQVAGDLLAEMRRMVRDQGWKQNWSGAH